MTDLFTTTPDLKTLSYEEIKLLASTCTHCGLCQGRKQVVFGVGPVPCDLMLIGEAPGEQEDLDGIPFVGRAGKLLTKIFEAVGIDREKEVYITNIVKCRPPDNRTPQAPEVESCASYLEAQIRHVQPKIILLTGSPAVKAVLKSDEPITKLRGKWTKLPGTEIYVLPVFHPSYLLRNPSRNPGTPKWLTWQDFQEVKNALDFIKKAKTSSD